MLNSLNFETWAKSYKNLKLFYLPIYSLAKLVYNIHFIIFTTKLLY